MNNFIELHEIQECAYDLQNKEDENKTYSGVIKGKILINKQHISLILPVAPLHLKKCPNFNQVTIGDTMTKIFLVSQKPQDEYLLVAESYDHVSKLIKES